MTPAAITYCRVATTIEVVERAFFAGLEIGCARELNIKSTELNGEIWYYVTIMESELPLKRVELY
nr:2378_t:CDS:2 [Entrophospora candida]